MIFFDILVVGGGLNGLLVANVLSKIDKSIKVLLIDKQQTSSVAGLDERTIAISLSTKAFFEKLGLWDKIAKNSGKIDYIYTFEKETKPILEFGLNDNNSSELGYTARCGDLKLAMLNSTNATINETENIIEVKSDDSFCYVKTDKNNYKAKLVIACDGKNSGIAQMLSIKMRQITYNQKAFVFNIKHSLEHKNIAVEQFTGFGPFATLPTTNANVSGVVWSLRADIADYLNTVSDEKFMEHLSKEALRLRHLGSITNIVTNKHCYPLSLTFLTKRHLGRCFFVGDSFHSIHPVAGQSFNMTLSDIKKLERYIQDCIKSGIDFGFEVHLQTLSRKLIKNHIAMTIATDGLVRLFSNNSQIIKFARSFGLDVFSSVSFLKKAAINKATNWK